MAAVRALAVRQRRTLAVLAIWGSALAAAAVPAAAQVATEGPVQSPARAEALQRVVRGRFTFVFAPTDTRLATSLAESAMARDSFPGLPRPQQPVEIWVAPDDAAFRRWVGDGAPEWGAAFAFPSERRVVLHGHRGGKAGDALEVLRHELAHLVLHEMLGDMPPRWFDEGYASYAAAEWDREDVLATNFALAIAFGRLPSFERLDSTFAGGATGAQAAYALSYRAVAELAAIDQRRGLAMFFQYWMRDRSLEKAMRQAYGLTLGGFEMHWQQATRRRYGGLALVTDAGAGAVLLALFVGPLWYSRRRRQRLRLEAMRQADAAQAERERASALAELLGEAPREGEH